jgi:virginiamycin B lyase
MLVRVLSERGVRKARVSAIAAAAALVATASVPAVAANVAGKVVDADGAPVPYVRIRVTGRNAAPYSMTAFTNAEGAFRIDYPQARANQLEIDAFRIGWKESGRDMKRAREDVDVQIRLRRVANVADQVPASAWLRGDPSSQGYQMATLQCSNCHQLGAHRVRAFSAKMADQPIGDRATNWVHRAAEDLAGPRRGKQEDDGKSTFQPSGRIAGWEAMVQYMRLVTMQLGDPPHLRWGLEAGGPFYQALLQPETSLFSPRDMAIIVPYLARNYPVVFDAYSDYDDVERLGEFGVNEKTRIDEYVLPTYGWTREVAIAPGSDKVWFVETDKDRLGALDPKTGAVKWYPIPGGGKGKHGPHTMNADSKGGIWAALEDSFHLGRFDTKTEQWKLCPPPAGKVFGVTHDFAFNSDRRVDPDEDGKIWITDMGMNELWGVDVASCDIKTYRQPLPVGETDFHSLLYGATSDAKNGRVWWAQLYGNVGSFDTKKKQTDRIIPFRRGEGPRRLGIAEDGTLWVPLFGASQLVKIDGDTGEELGRWQIPDRGAAPYGITIDKKRNAIWAATSNSDRIYRFDIDTQKWRHYPMPRAETYIRMIELDPETGDVWTTYSSLPVGRRDPKVHGFEGANNVIVRLHPGD